jgi:DNA-directed RNA polymerase specialized sigma24 family protein
LEAEAYVALTARYETPMFSYAARMLGGLRDGERCLVAALADGWSELDGGAEPARPQEWFTALMREHCFDELARRAPAGPEDTLEGTGDCVALAADAALAAVRPAYRDLLLLSDVHGLDSALLSVLTDMSEPDVGNQLYRARAEFASAYSAQRAPDRCPLRRRDCPDCAERERLRGQPQHALLHLGPLAVRDQVRGALRARVSG